MSFGKRKKSSKQLPPKGSTAVTNIRIKKFNAKSGKFLKSSSSEPMLPDDSTKVSGSRVPGQALGIKPSQTGPWARPPLPHLGRPNILNQAHLGLGKDFPYQQKLVG